MAPLLIQRTIAVVVGDPDKVANRIEAVFKMQDVAAVCKVKQTNVKIDVSTLDLEEKDLEERVEAWIEQAAADVAARIRWVEGD
jgi:hypothetical protein